MSGLRSHRQGWRVRKRREWSEQTVRATEATIKGHVVRAKVAGNGGNLSGVAYNSPRWALTRTIEEQ